MPTITKQATTKARARSNRSFIMNKDNIKKRKAQVIISFSFPWLRHVHLNTQKKCWHWHESWIDCVVTRSFSTSYDGATGASRRNSFFFNDLRRVFKLFIWTLKAAWCSNEHHTKKRHYIAISLYSEVLTNKERRWKPSLFFLSYLPDLAMVHLSFNPVFTKQIDEVDIFNFHNIFLSFAGN